MQKRIEGLADSASKSIKDACAEWGLEVGNNMPTINADKICPPILEFGGNRTEEAKSRRGDAGEWDISGKNFFKEK